MTHQQALPAGVFPYRRTPIFDENTTPGGLRRDHRTVAGVWGLITVIDGRLRFRTLAPRCETVPRAGDTAVVKPEEPHAVAADGPVRFFVDFCRAGKPDAAGT